MVQYVDGIIMIEFVETSLTDLMQVEKIRTDLAAIVAGAEAPKIIISFDGVVHISSPVLGALMSVQKQAKDKGGELHVIKVPPEIMQIIELTRIDRIVKVYKNFEDAKVFK